MGFYHPATVVKDAQRHGVEVRPIDVTRSAWKCTLEDGALRLGLRYVQGLRAEAAERLVAARPLGSVAEAAQRAELTRSELETLAHAGAFAALGLARREALWQAAAVERDPTSLLARVRPQAAGAPLPPMTPCEETAADYAATRLTAGPHVMAHLRSRLAADGVLAARAPEQVPHGARVRGAGKARRRGIVGAYSEEEQRSQRRRDAPEFGDGLRVRDTSLNVRMRRSHARFLHPCYPPAGRSAGRHGGCSPPRHAP